MSELVKRLRECSDDWPAYLTKLDREAADALEAQAKRIAELESSLADSNEALQILGLKLAQAEADRARLDWIEDNSYALPYKDHGAGPELDLSRPAIDALMKDQIHSSTAPSELLRDIPERS